MYPNTATYPQLNFEAITSKHLFYDLIYNPPKTMLLKEAERRGAIIKNGMDMLIMQAKKSWEIWYD